MSCLENEAATGHHSVHKNRATRRHRRSTFCATPRAGGRPIGRAPQDHRRHPPPTPPRSQPSRRRQHPGPRRPPADPRQHRCGFARHRIRHTALAPKRVAHRLFAKDKRHASVHRSRPSRRHIHTSPTSFATRRPLCRGTARREDSAPSAPTFFGQSTVAARRRGSAYRGRAPSAERKASQMARRSSPLQKASRTAANNRANQLNPNNSAFWSSRGVKPGNNSEAASAKDSSPGSGHGARNDEDT